MFTKITCTVIILFVKITTTDTRINKILQSVNDQTHKNTMSGNVMQLVSTCYTETLNMVVFAGTFHNFENWRINFSPLLTMYNVGLSESTIFNRHKRLEKVYSLEENVVSKLRYPSKLFIISSTAQFNIAILLDRLKRSVLWNSRAIFFLVNEELKTKCSNASFELKEAWKFNILYAFYVCYNENEIQLYTFDPFTVVAPDTWKILKTIYVNYNTRSDSLAIFKYSSPLTIIDRSVCQRLDLDKTADFNGYTIHIIAWYSYNMFQSINNSNFSSIEPQPLSKFKGVDVEMINATFDKVHLKALVSICSSIGFIDEKNKAHGIIHKLLEERIDMGANERYRRGFWRLETYPHDMTDMCVMTSRKIRHQNITHGLKLIMMSQSKALMISTLMILAGIVILMCVLKIQFVAAALEFLRLLIGTSLFKQPDHSYHGWRLLLLIIVLFSFWVNLYFGTQLTSSFAIKIDDPNINNIDDLIESGYDIAGHKSYEEFLPTDLFHDRFQEASITDCLRDILPRGNVACLIDCYQADHYAKKYKNTSIHISGAIYSTYVAYIVREDWPLLPRINDIIRNLKESGIYLYFYAKHFYHSESYFAERKKNEMKMNNDVGFQGKPLSTKKLIHSIYIYYFGIAAGLAAFLTELFAKICF